MGSSVYVAEGTNLRETSTTGIHMIRMQPSPHKSTKTRTVIPAVPGMALLFALTDPLIPAALRADDPEQLRAAIALLTRRFSV